ncbi:MAG: class II fructose-bisphosphate aldolase family protein [Chloroflexi bacterium OHK40]
MLSPMTALLHDAAARGAAIGAFNVYNLEGVRAVINAAEAEASPVILQVHPGALRYGGQALLALCLAAAQESQVPVAVHLDHSTAASDMRRALEAGVRSIMADGSHLPFADNLRFTREMVELARAHGATVEAELGRLAGTEDGLTLHEAEAHYTNPEQAAVFVARTGIDALAVCIGNVHGHYHREPQLDFVRLAALREAVPVPLVLHGASGLPDTLIRTAITLGVRKINVNTELRVAYVHALRAASTARVAPELLELLGAAVAAMQTVVATKIRLFNDG